MKVLFTAAGSIGSRHITNISAVCKEKNIPIIIDVIRNTDRVLPEHIKTLVRNEIRNDEGIDEFYDILFITDETGLHYDSICKYEKKAKNIFIEKPIFEKTNYDIDFLLNENSDRIFYVAAPIRFTKYYFTIKKLVNENKVFSARVIFSDYMPNWQKGRDYRKSFRCFQSRGGGVDCDSIHEIDYVVDLFGNPQNIHAVRGHFSKLEMDACDIATYIFEYDDKVVEIHLDYFGRKRTRCIELYTADDVIIVDFDKANCTWKLSEKVMHYGPDNHFYEDEMAYFLDLISCKKRISNINSIQKAISVLKIAKMN